eukprot:scaffold6672_cov21-Tisochrysis_lutea.AAC.7
MSVPLCALAGLCGRDSGIWVCFDVRLQAIVGVIHGSTSMHRARHLSALACVPLQAFVDVIHKYVAELRAGGPTDQSSSTTQPSSNKPSGATTGRTKLSSATPEEVKPSTSGTASK